MNYLATFYTHFAAMTFARGLSSRGIPGRMMPVPRKLSASCGTCVSFDTNEDVTSFLVEDTEAVFRREGETFTLVYQHQDC